MEEALQTTEEGRKRLAAAEERMNQRLAKEVEEADARPEGEKVAEKGSFKKEPFIGPGNGLDELFEDDEVLDEDVLAAAF